MKNPLKKILYVEDEPDIRTIAVMSLEMGGFEIQSCDSGKAALDVVDQFNPDLILLDVMMPNMDGPATLAALRKNPKSQKIPVVFMTAKVQSQEIAAYKKMGALDVIAKPFDPLLLSENILKIWKKI